MKKKYIIISLFIIIFLFVTLALILSNRETNKVKKVASTFLEFIKEKDIENALEIVYFDEKYKKELYELTKEGFEGEELKDYKINSIKKLNDNIFKLNISLDGKLTDNFNPYVIKIDNKWFLVINSFNIPNDLIGDTNIDANPDELDFRDIIPFTE